MSYTWSTKPCSYNHHHHPSNSFVQSTKPLLVLLVHLASSVENTFLTLFQSCTSFHRGCGLGLVLQWKHLPIQLLLFGAFSCGCGDLEI